MSSVIPELFVEHVVIDSWPFSLEENLSITAICCNLAIATHSEKNA